MISGVRLPSDGGSKIPINLSCCSVQQRAPQLQKSLISLSQVARLRAGGGCACTSAALIRFPHLHTIKVCSGPLRRWMTGRETYEGPSVFLGQTKAGNESARSSRQSAGRLLGVPTCLPPLASQERFRRDRETSGFPCALGCAAAKAKKKKKKKDFQPLMKTDIVPSTEKDSLF